LPAVHWSDLRFPIQQFIRVKRCVTSLTAEEIAIYKESARVAHKVSQRLPVCCRVLAKKKIWILKFVH
jgi:hypothetical protein